MSAIGPTSESKNQSISLGGENGEVDQRSYKPLVSLVVPAYNEAPIVEQNLATLCHYMASLAEG
jgi:cellulose synthase/poly-beta-1,6-N-acetylglucosamine synthase-like glycosyltransferase